MDGLARAMQEALARLCGQNVNKVKDTRFFHYARHDSMGQPLDVPSHPDLKNHVEHLEFMLHVTRKELDNSRAYANHTQLTLARQTDTFKIMAKERKSLRHQRAKKDYIIACLYARITSLEETIQAQETQLKDL